MLWSIISKILIDTLIDLLAGLFIKLAMAAFSAILNTISMNIQPSHVNLAH
ncbi:hypothetical protein KDK_01000 [Dictyobacter kobayashii]|uniref:Uncharacterized protein n=1 Tax=Dictyobacter kobayashii TaxID=2014872 RepID=A0A402AB05_9CHLR|nr:hypothetical protein KDK_01000 [Dictyobacter kobayashii]